MSLNNLETTHLSSSLMIFRVRRKVFKILTPSERKGDLSWYFDIFLIALISLNVIAIVLESIPFLRTNYGEEFHIFDLVSVIFFTIEYLLRVWTCNEEEKYRTPVLGNLKYMGSTMALIDLFSIIPFYLPLMGFDLRIFRILRLMRLFRLFKLARYVRAIKIMDSVLKEKKTGPYCFYYICTLYASHHFNYNVSC